MPELPEVETIKLGLQSKIIHLKIKKIEVLNPKTFQGDPDLLIGKTVLQIWRKAKVLGIDLGDTGPASSLSPVLVTLLFHLKMSGQIIFEGKSLSEKRKEESVIGGHPTKDMLGHMPSKSTRVIFIFEDGSKLYFNDQRKFGWIKLVNSEQITENSFFKSLGPEPLEETFNWEILKDKLSRRKKTAVKVALLDQTVVSGIGNIYACEACFLAKIDPRKLVGQLTDTDYKNLVSGIVQSLKTSIEYGGSSKQHYFNESGEKGYFLEKAFVYDRKGLPCRICKTPIEKITLGGRGTYFCPNCQMP